MNAQLEAFRSKVNTDANLQEQIKNGADLIALAKANGFSFSKSELQEGLAALDSEDSDLSDFELGLVSGGWSGPGDWGKPEDNT